MSQRPTPPRGMRDLLPAEVAQRRVLLNTILDVFGRYGFEQIETPVIEEIDRLRSSEGGENNTLVYKILKRGLAEWPAGEADAVDLGLRYDLTVPLARFFASNSDRLLLPFRSLQTGPVFRAERPQKGRYRQFTQCDVDILGEHSAIAEIEALLATCEALRECNAGGFTVRANDRRILEALVFSAGFAEAQLSSVLIALDKLDKIGAEGVAGELQKIDDGTPSKKLIATLEEMISAGSDWQKIAGAVSGAVGDALLQDLTQVKEGLQSAAPWVEFTLDPTLVRGMGYYTGPIFEFEHADFSGSIAGGGRYDRMIGKLSGVDTPAVGVSIGFERLCHILENKGSLVQSETKVALLYGADTPVDEVARVAAALRSENYVVRTDVAVKNRKAQLSRLANGGYTHWALVADSAMPVLQPLSEE